MTPADAARLLSIAAAFDQRTIGEADAIAWADALEGLDPGECAEAIRHHFRGSDARLMPSHVRDYVRMLRQREAEHRWAQQLHAELPPLDPELNHERYLMALQEFQNARDSA
jgi:hypothetical protein